MTSTVREFAACTERTSRVLGLRQVEIAAILGLPAVDQRMIADDNDRRVGPRRHLRRLRGPVDQSTSSSKLRPGVTETDGVVHFPGSRPLLSAAAVEDRRRCRSNGRSASLPIRSGQADRRPSTPSSSATVRCRPLAAPTAARSASPPQSKRSKCRSGSPSSARSTPSAPIVRYDADPAQRGARSDRRPRSTRLGLRPVARRDRRTR